MPSQVAEQRFSDYLKRVFGRKESTALTLLEDVMPVAAVLDPAAAELRIYRGELSGLYFQSQAAIAAQFAGIAFGLPTTSNLCAVIERALVYTGAASGARAQFASSGQFGALNLLQGAGNADRRSFGQLNSTPRPTNLGWVVRSNAAGLGNQDIWRVPSTLAAVDFEGPVILGPGNVLYFEADTVNVSLNVTLWWRERSSPTETAV
jgi:hypothetical protein